MSRFFSVTLVSLTLCACGGSTALASTDTSEDAVLAGNGSTGADSDGGCNRGRGPRRPPPEAFTACASSTEGAACSVTHDGHTLEGSCRATPEGEGLACAPNGPPPGERRGPPQEAIDACASLSADAACSVTHDGHTLTGTCRTGPDGNGPLACAPAGNGPPPQRRR